MSRASFSVNIQQKVLGSGAVRHVVRWRPGGAAGPQRAVPFAEYDHAVLYAALVRVHQADPTPAQLHAAGLGFLAPAPDPDPAPALPGAGSGPTLIEACESYLDTLVGVVLANTLADYRSLLACHLVPYFGPEAKVGHPGAALAGLTRAQLREWQDWMAGRRSVKTVKNVKVAVLGPVLKAACRPADDGSAPLLEHNPLEGLRAPRAAGARPARRRMLDVGAGDYFALARTIDPDGADVLLAAAGTGARRGELFALRADAVDLAAGLVWIRRVARRQGRGAPRGQSARIEDDTKTTAGDRPVPIPPELVAMFTARLAAAGRDGLIFPNPRTGGLWLGTAWQRFMDKLHTARGAGPAGHPGRITAHSWRHAYKSWIAAGGVDPSTQAGTLGHSGPDVGDRVYFHLTRHGQAQIGAALAPILADLVPADGRAA